MSFTKVIVSRSLVCLALLGGTAGLIHAQATQSPSVEVALTYVTDRAQTAGTDNHSFWPQGAALDAAYNFRGGFGLVGSVQGSSKTAVLPGIDVNRIFFLVGERYTLPIKSKNPHGEQRFSVYGQWLIGGVHAFDGVYPDQSTQTVNTSANAFAFQLGGGANVALAHGFGLRIFEADYQHSSLPNNTYYSQDSFHLATGITYRFGTKKK